jgi:hypothetical protein
MWLAAAPAHGDVATPSGEPSAFVFSANGNLYVGNSTRVPGPVACNGTMLLDERVQVTAAVARRDLKMRLLTLVTGDAPQHGRRRAALEPGAHRRHRSPPSATSSWASRRASTATS